MARPPAATPDEPTRVFTVCRGRALWDNDGIRRTAGQPVSLTHKQAVYHKERGTIEVPLEEFDDAAATDNGANTDEASSGAQTDGGGKPEVGDPRPSASSSL